MEGRDGLLDRLPARERPYPAEWSVRQGLDAFLLENGYRESDYDLKRTPAMLLGVKFGVPNPPRHRWAIMRHDLHHIATGYGTDMPGEAELAAWELRRGIRPLGLYVGSIVVSGFLSGFFIAPRRMLRAWGLTKNRGDLFHMDDAYESLLTMTIGGLRESLGLPADGLARGRRGLNALAPHR